MSVKTIISEDKHSVSVSISGDFSTYELEKLVFELSQIRASMQPQVVDHQPTTAEQAITSIEKDPAFSLHILKNGDIQIWFRTSGLGWIIFNIPIAKACVLRDYIQANTQEISGADLLTKGPGGSDVMQ